MEERGGGCETKRAESAGEKVWVGRKEIRANIDVTLLDFAFPIRDFESLDRKISRAMKGGIIGELFA